MHEKLRVNLENSRTYLNRYERLLMQLTQYELDGHAEFLDGESAFRLHSCPFSETEGIPLGLYELPRRSGEAHLYRLSHPLAMQVLERAKSRVLSPAEVVFDYAGYGARIAALEPYIGNYCSTYFPWRLWIRLKTIFCLRPLTQEGKCLMKIRPGGFFPFRRQPFPRYPHHQ